jgi:RNA polymerase sigma-70 factor (ECF subfamily)
VAQFRGTSAEQLASWLRQILSRNLADAMRGLGAAKRELHRRQSLEEAMEQSSRLFGAWLVADQSSPSQHAQREERALQVADALAQLPPAQREALVLQYWHGYTLAQIAAHLGRRPAAVAGLLKRGLKQLQTLL